MLSRRALLGALMAPTAQGSYQYPVRLDPWHRIVEIGWGVAATTLLIECRKYVQGRYWDAVGDWRFETDAYNPQGVWRPHGGAYGVLAYFGIGYRVTLVPPDDPTNPLDPIVRPIIGAHTPEPFVMAKPPDIIYPPKTPQSDQPDGVRPYRPSREEVFYIPAAGDLPSLDRYYSAVLDTYEYWDEAPAGMILADNEPSVDSAVFPPSHFVINLRQLRRDFRFNRLLIDLYVYENFAHPLEFPVRFDLKAYSGGKFVLVTGDDGFPLIKNQGGREITAQHQTLNISAVGAPAGQLVFPKPKET